MTKSNLSNLTLQQLNSPEFLTDYSQTPNPNEYITIRGAKEHNLKNASLILPKNKLVTFSGLSGSGKSSLVFDTIYAEGQRRYVESLSSYARQFLGLKDKPDVDSIDGLSPAISIDQKSTSQNPRSTVGTITEIYDYLRLLYAKIGHQHCTVCSSPITNESVTTISKRLLVELDKQTIIVLSPIAEDQKGVFRQQLAEAAKNGYSRVRFDGNIILIENFDKQDLKKSQKHSIELVIDKITLNDDNKLRFLDSLETAMKLSDGKALILQISEEKENLIHINKNRACPNGHGSPGVLEPRLFSFNSPHGYCQNCNGLGTVSEIDPGLVVPNGHLSIIEGAIKPFSRMSLSGGWLTKIFENLSVKHNFDLHTEWNKLPKKVVDIIFNGDGQFEGVLINLKRRYLETTSDSARRDIESYMNKRQCSVCSGTRLKLEARSVKLAGSSIDQITSMSIKEAIQWFAGLNETGGLTNTEKEIAKMVVKEVKTRLQFLMDVGLEYLTLARSADTLSGGEAQRIRLATQIGSGLTGVLYILDEPSIGLHQRDNTRLLHTLKKLRDLGNSVLVVEHDEDTIQSSDFVIDVGPKAGQHGGNIVAVGTPEEVKNNPNSPTGRFLAGIDIIEIPKKRRKVNLNNYVNTEAVKDIENDLKASWNLQVETIIKNSR